MLDPDIPTSVNLTSHNKPYARFGVVTQAVAAISFLSASMVGIILAAPMMGLTISPVLSQWITQMQVGALVGSEVLWLAMGVLAILAIVSAALSVLTQTWQPTNLKTYYKERDPAAAAAPTAAAPTAAAAPAAAALADAAAAARADAAAATRAAAAAATRAAAAARADADANVAAYTSLAATVASEAIQDAIAIATKATANVAATPPSAAVVSRANRRTPNYDGDTDSSMGRPSYQRMPGVMSLKKSPTHPRYKQHVVSSPQSPETEETEMNLD